MSGMLTTNLGVGAAAVPVVPARLRPVGESERLLSLDVLRGFALLGILMVNMQSFTMPFMRMMHDPSLADGPLSEKLASAFVKTFFEYKFISMFSLLFGAGFAVQLMRAEARTGAGKSVIPVYIRRLFVLMLFGAAHAFGLWYGDILLVYALGGFGLLLFGFFKPKTLLIIAGVFLAVGILLSLLSGLAQVLMMGAAGEQMAQRYEEGAALVASGEAKRGFDGIQQAQWDPNNPIWSYAETMAFKEGPFTDALAFRVVSYAFMFMAGIFSFFWHVFAMFLLGAAMMKLQFFSPSRAVWHKRLVLIALPVGLLLELANAVQGWISGYDFSIMTIVMLPLHEIGSVVLCLGYIGVWCMIVDRGWLKPVTAAIANVGRMALTNYIMQTVVSTFLMYWWGLAWFGDVSRVQMIQLVLAIYASQLALSVAWMSVFRMGPLEWLWRTLTYLRPQPILRSSTP